MPKPERYLARTDTLTPRSTRRPRSGGALGGPLLGRLTTGVLRDSLYRNSLFIMVNMVLTSVSGFAFWFIAAHLYTPRDVGYGTSLIAAITMVIAFAGLGISRSVLRFLHGHPTRPTFLITATGLVVILTAAGSGVAALFLQRFGIRSVEPEDQLLFIVTATVAAGKGMFDVLFVALRRSAALLWLNLPYNLLRLVILALLRNQGLHGILLAQCVSVFAAVVVGVVLLRRHGYDLRLPRPRLSSMSGTWGFGVTYYFTDLVGGLPNSLLPILLLSRIGPEASASWFLASQVAAILTMISSSVGQSMFAEAAAQEGRLWAIVRQSARAVGLALFLPTCLCLLFPRTILLVFGQSYADAAGGLRLLAASAFLVAITGILGSVLSIARKISLLLVVNTINAVVVIGSAASWVSGPTSMGVAWLLGEAVNVVGFGLGVGGYVRRPGKHRATVR